MGYKYFYSYKDLVTGKVVEQGVQTSEKLFLDELFLDAFIFLIEKVYSPSYGVCVSCKGKNGFYPLSVSNLCDESAIIFKKMEFKLISGQANLKESRRSVERC